ncbi:MAG TPA: hypothetical protein DCG12_00915 [Planctomycetaceae bacterium]|nr:hypothetical protein [Planctomycetaceae bacterium]
MAVELKSEVLHPHTRVSRHAERRAVFVMMTPSDWISADVRQNTARGAGERNEREPRIFRDSGKNGQREPPRQTAPTHTRLVAFRRNRQNLPNRRLVCSSAP